jgi:hypothetical protein
LLVGEHEVHLVCLIFFLRGIHIPLQIHEKAYLRG